MEKIIKIDMELDDHVYGIEMDSGRKFSVWNGRACYSLNDVAQGCIEIGSILVGEKEDRDGTYILTFAKP